MRSKESYIVEFASLRRNRQFEKPAPHKIIYLLAIIDSITAGFIRSNRFNFIPQIKSKFLDNWERFVGNEETYKANVFQPAYYCDSDTFYRLILADDQTKKPPTSEKGFNKTFLYIEIDNELFFYIRDDKAFAAELRVALLKNLL